MHRRGRGSTFCGQLPCKTHKSIFSGAAPRRGRTAPQSQWFRMDAREHWRRRHHNGYRRKVTFLNAVAQALTGWPQTDALGHMLPDVLADRPRNHARARG